ncbi:MAG: hopanoid C-3 methylase HpnR [Planctomycetes bacterium]|nr:hopanoid C-3 methylase HpnR [Planctomycetota bacterium]
MKVMLVHPSALMYAEVYLRLEPLGLERVGAALRAGGHDVRMVDLQIFNHMQLMAELDEYRPDAVAFSLNYLANIPEVIDLAKAIKSHWPDTFIFIGGHSISFVAEEVLEHGEGAIDCIIQGEGEITAPLVVDNMPNVDGLPGVRTRDSVGPKPALLEDLDQFRPARDLARHRRKYFIGVLDPCASIEFTRGCPWDCSFCSAWTFYGRSYRKGTPEGAAADMASIKEPNVFIVDDVAFVHEEHGMAIADAIESRGIKKRYYLETRCDVLLRNEHVFKRWAKMGLEYMFLGFESLNEDQLKMFRKRITPNDNFKALEVARRLGIQVAINLIADPSWGEAEFKGAMEWALQVPEVVHLTVATPYPGTELFHTEQRRLSTLDYRLYDIQHAVMPTKLPLERFYQLLVETQSIINRKSLGWKTAFALSGILARQWMRGQFNTTRMLFSFSKVYAVGRQLGDHRKPVKYEMRRADHEGRKIRKGQELYIHNTGLTVSAGAERAPEPVIVKSA